MLLALYITLGYFTLFFIVATLIKNNSIVDIGWGLGFVVTSWVPFFVYGTYSLTSVIVNALVSLWGLRLFYHILKRNIFEEEDFRYQAWRKAWGKYVIPRAFIQVFMLQGILQFMIGSVSYYINVNDVDFKVVSLIGAAIWLIGYYYQVIGDKQLKDHIESKKRNLINNRIMVSNQTSKLLWRKLYVVGYFYLCFIEWSSCILDYFSTNYFRGIILYQYSYVRTENDEERWMEGVFRKYTDVLSV
jgi:steroid 5-alpha reductase family enzyme